MTQQQNQTQLKTTKDDMAEVVESLRATVPYLSTLHHLFYMESNTLGMVDRNGLFLGVATLTSSGVEVSPVGQGHKLFPGTDPEKFSNLHARLAVEFFYHMYTAVSRNVSPTYQ